MKTYYQPTPKKYRKIGDAILIGCASLSALVMGSPLTDNGKAWTTFILNVVGVAGKVISNFAKEEDSTETTQN